MVNKKRKVIWDTEAIAYFKQAISYIKNDSPKNAVKVKNDILASTKKLSTEASMHHPIDKYRSDNNDNYRAYEMYHYRIAYFISEEYIRIVRMRHTSMEPKEY